MGNVLFYRASFESREVCRKNIKERKVWICDFFNLINETRVIMKIIRQINLLSIFCLGRFDEIVVIDRFFFLLNSL